MGYTRKAITWASSSSSTKSNSAVVEFSVATGDWGTISHGAVYDALSGGNFCGSNALTASKSVTTGQTFRLPIGALDITLG